MTRQRLLIPMLLVFCAGAGWWQWKPTSAPNAGHKTGSTSPGDSDYVLSARLDEAKQKAIWDAEHVTFEIETHVGRKLVADGVWSGDYCLAS